MPNPQKHTMKLSKFLISLSLLISSQLIPVAAQYHTFLEDLSRIDRLPVFRENVISAQVSSYDTTGGNSDGFSGRYSFLREENGTQVIAELEGPGIIHRIWTPTPTSDTIQFFFDGETNPRINLKFIDLFSGNQHPFLRPVVGNEIGGFYCYLPIPYAESCKIVYKGEMKFFQIQYSKVARDVMVESFPVNFSKSENEILESINRMWSNYGENILDFIYPNPEEIKAFTKKFIIKPGQTIPVFKLNKGGRIAGIEITPGTELNKQFKDLIFRASWDNEPVAAINSPVSDFFSYAFGSPSMKSLLMGVNGRTHYCYLPMPFDKKASLELQFLKNPLNNLVEIPVSITVFYTQTPRASNEGKFYAEWKRDKPDTGEFYQILNKSGRGHYVGTLLQCQGLNPGMTVFFEGDDQCYIDGELRLHGTGSEDYFNGGWYADFDRWDQGFSLPLHGSLDYSIPLARTGGFRFLVSDKVSFEKDILFQIEHGRVGNNVPVDYISMAFYYCDAPPVSNDLPDDKLLHPLESPETMEYWVNMLPVVSISDGAKLSKINLKDQITGKEFKTYALEAQNEMSPLVLDPRYNGFVKFELEVPSRGRYKLYFSYFKGMEGGNFDIYQRQIPIKTNISGYTFTGPVLIEKEYMETVSLNKGSNTLTVLLSDDPEGMKNGKFYLHRIYLEKVPEQ
jgi:hypothetical protein